MFDISGTAGSWLYRPLWVPVVVDPAMAHHKSHLYERTALPLHPGSFFGRGSYFVLLRDPGRPFSYSIFLYET